MMISFEKQRANNFSDIGQLLPNKMDSFRILIEMETKSGILIRWKPKVNPKYRGKATRLEGKNLRSLFFFD